jgi:hypothetical protein
MISIILSAVCNGLSPCLEQGESNAMPLEERGGVVGVIAKDMRENEVFLDLNLGSDKVWTETPKSSEVNSERLWLGSLELKTLPIDLDKQELSGTTQGRFGALSNRNRWLLFDTINYSLSIVDPKGQTLETVLGSKVRSAITLKKATENELVGSIDLFGTDRQANFIANFRHSAISTTDDVPEVHETTPKAGLKSMLSLSKSGDIQCVWRGQEFVSGGADTDLPYVSIYQLADRVLFDTAKLTLHLPEMSAIQELALALRNVLDLHVYVLGARIHFSKTMQSENITSQHYLLSVNGVSVDQLMIQRKADPKAFADWIAKVHRSRKDGVNLLVKRENDRINFRVSVTDDQSRTRRGPYETWSKKEAPGAPAGSFDWNYWTSSRR